MSLDVRRNCGDNFMIKDVLSRFSPRNVLETRCHYPNKSIKLDLPPNRNLYLPRARILGPRGVDLWHESFLRQLWLSNAPCALPSLPFVPCLSTIFGRKIHQEFPALFCGLVSSIDTITRWVCFSFMFSSSSGVKMG